MADSLTELLERRIKNLKEDIRTCRSNAEERQYAEELAALCSARLRIRDTELSARIEEIVGVIPQYQEPVSLRESPNNSPSYQNQSTPSRQSPPSQTRSAVKVARPAREESNQSGVSKRFRHLEYDDPQSEPAGKDDSTNYKVPPLKRFKNLEYD